MRSKAAQKGSLKALNGSKANGTIARAAGAG